MIDEQRRQAIEKIIEPLWQTISVPDDYEREANAFAQKATVEQMKQLLADDLIRQTIGEQLQERIRQISLQQNRRKSK